MDKGHYVACDICGSKIPYTEATVIKDKYHPYNNMLVCKNDLDLNNPQEYPNLSRPERSVTDINTLRSEPGYVYAHIDSYTEIVSGESTLPAGLAPEAPTDLVVQRTTTSTTLKLTWETPQVLGSQTLQGYKIERESPVGNGFSTIVSLNPSEYYEDTALSTSTQYNYRISAVNRYGTSSPCTAVSVTTGS